MPEVSVITVTYNSSETIRQCLDSVRNQTFKDLEHIVVDNASGDGIASLIKAGYPEVRLIENSHNAGFSKANNQAILSLKARYILTLNPDALLEPDFIQRVIDFMKKEPADSRIGMISGKILRDDRNILDSTGIVLTAFRRFYDRGSNLQDNGKYSKPEKIFGPCAAAAFYKRETLEDTKVNGEYFDEDFFCFVEDVDLAWRANKRGWNSYYLPEARCYHSRDSLKYKKSFLQYCAFRNRFFMNIKNDSFNFFTIPSVLFYDIPKFLFMLLTNLLTARAFKEAVCLTPKMLTKRK